MVHNFYNNKNDLSREIYIETDNSKIITYISKNCYDILGYSQEELINKNIIDYISTIPENIISTTNFEGTFILKNATSITIDAFVAPMIYNNGTLIGLKISFIDISKYKKTNTTEKKLLEMLERSKDIIYRFEVHPQAKFTYLSPSIETILGYSLEDHVNNPYLPFKITNKDDNNYLLGKLSGNFNFFTPKPVQYKHKNGSYVWLEDYTTPIYDAKGKYIAFEGFARDITERKELEEKLEKLSFSDGLTNLHNKLYLEKQIDILNTKIDTPIGIIFCDLDNLKITNDNLGHEFGDKLILYTSNVLKDTFEKNSIIARIGGDEFVVLIKDTSLDDVKNLYSLLRNSIEQQNKYNKELPISISIGYSFSETSIGITRQVINIADKNMYKDKQKKKL